MIVNGILFCDEAHYNFFVKKAKEFTASGGRLDSYSRSLFYLFGVCADTRQHIGELFCMKERIICLDALEHGWQTGTSRKITRLAFNLWNGHGYECESDGAQNSLSPYFLPDEIFCCCFQEFFFEAIRLRFPEYSNR